MCDWGGGPNEIQNYAEDTAPSQNDGNHPCPKAGCSQRLPFEILACKPHWFALPPRLRNSITRSWASGDIERYMKHRDEAVAVLNA